MWRRRVATAGIAASFCAAHRMLSCEAEAPSDRSITREELASHRTTASCWMSIDNKVFDVTALLQSHPGGSSVLLQHAGRDASTAFNALHGPSVLPEIGAQYQVGILQATPEPEEPAS